MIRTKKTPKNAENFYCEKCNFTCSKNSEYERHLTTAKHKNRTILNEKTPKTPKNAEYVCECGKFYSARNSLWYHKKKCKYIDNVDNKGDILDNEEIHDEVIIENKIIEKEDIDYKGLFIQAINEMKEQRHEFLTQLHEQQEERKRKDEMMMGMIGKVGNTTNNNNININVFLNEKCKDALNIMDFVNSLQLQLTDLENTGKLGFVEGTTKIFLDGLKQLNVCERPIHCADLKKDIVYIKDDNEWKEDKSKEKIKKAINTVNDNNIKQMADWIQVNDKEDMDGFEQIVSNVVNPNIDKDSDKIIKNISKEVQIPDDFD